MMKLIVAFQNFVNAPNFVIAVNLIWCMKVL